ncbi:MAG: YraN family protein [Oscillospiraceae bacterium]|nr:YraN family protein [Oscillospiraceae bacterium]
MSVPNADRRKKSVGASGEQLAADYLSAQGYAILARNYRAGHNEIDIIAENGGGIVVVEVKARGTLYDTPPREAVTAVKQARIIAAAEQYLAENEAFDKFVRFDVIEVFADRIIHIRRAFDLPYES